MSNSSFKEAKVHLKEQRRRTILQLNKLIQRCAFTTCRLNLTILLTMWQKRHQIQHQVPIPATPTILSSTNKIQQPPKNPTTKPRNQILKKKD
jgi:hypothetical protein